MENIDYQSICKHLDRHGKISVPEVQKLLNVPYSVARFALSTMQSKNYLRVEGNTFYLITQTKINKTEIEDLTFDALARYEREQSTYDSEGLKESSNKLQCLKAINNIMVKNDGESENRIYVRGLYYESDMSYPYRLKLKDYGTLYVTDGGMTVEYLEAIGIKIESAEEKIIQDLLASRYERTFISAGEIVRQISRPHFAQSDLIMLVTATKEIISAFHK